MRIMGIDYGDARIGIAVSDISATLVGDAWTLNERNFERAAEKIAEEASGRGVGRIVVGNPLNMDGTVGPRSEKCRDFAELVREKSGLDVVMWDERRTTVDAHRILAENGRRAKDRKQTVDAVAALLILEGYLASLK